MYTNERKSAPRRRRTSKPAAPVLKARDAEVEITPLEERHFARYYELADKRRGVSVELQQGVAFCGRVDAGCSWCQEHQNGNHATPDPTKLYLSFTCEPVGGSTGSGTHESFSGEMSARSLDALIELLVQARDRARADGVLAAAT
jgi:hypothetical protein